MPNYRGLAEDLIAKLQRFHRKERSSDGGELQDFLQSLKEQGLVAIRGANGPKYLIRLRVSGSPLLLDAHDGEVGFRHFGFASCCHDILTLEGKDVSLLQVLLV